MLKTKLQSLLSVPVLENEPLSKYSSIKVGGPTDVFVNVTTLEDLAACIRFCKETEIEYFILGGGTNTLISDAGFRGLVIKTVC